MIAEMRNEIGEELVIAIAAFGMILNGQREGVIAEPYLFDDVVGGAPGFDLEAVAEFIESLMMRAIYLLEAMGGGTIRS